MKTKGRIAVMLLFFITIALSAAAWGQDIKDRMEARLPAIKALKKAGVIGENNQGYLVVRQATDQKALVDAENQDRRLKYMDIAGKMKVTPEYVGQRRAMKIAQEAGSGTWIQDPDGRWRQK
jgi:uncharacterized protein YdbL (DUF1318 family)